MTPERWGRVREVLEAALDRPASEREGFLDDTCGDDAGLRREVESLLASDEGAQTFLETGPAPGVLRSFAAAPPPAIGTRIGPYKLLAEIAHGGMGVVYLAARDDDAYRQQVAVKLVNAEASSEAGLARFRQERQILADLEHANIARLLDGGTTEAGSPYFVMEHVQGRPIDGYCQARNLTVPEKLELFSTVCSAVAYAHRRGVVHRDLKPNNILVTSEGVPKLLDFGIAKLHAPSQGTSDATRTGLPLMTPEYASPEQVRADTIGPASDVYTLGVLLYRLLTGRSPYPATSDRPHELASAICEADPLPPSRLAGPTVARRLKGDLDAIVAKAMRKEPSQRYASAEELAGDIKRHLAGAPVAARKGRLLYAARRRARRHARLGAWAVVVAGVAALVTARFASFSGNPPGQAPRGAIRSLAVLPLANLSGDPEQDYFADGLTEALITDLSKIAALRVTSRTSVMGYKERKKALPEIARELKVDGIVTGSVLRAGGTIRVTAQLLHAVEDHHLWAGSYERDLRDVLVVQGDVARSIARAVAVNVTSQEEARLATRRLVDPRSYDAYLQGRFYWNKRTEDGVRKAIGRFQQATAIDPGYAPAYAGLADAYLVLGDWGYAAPGKTLPLAGGAARKAVQLDDGLAEAHCALARFLLSSDLDWPAGEREFRRAIDLDPSYATARYLYAQYLSRSGRHAGAEREAEQARQLDPFSSPANTVKGWIHIQARQNDRAIAQLRETVELNPAFWPAHLWLAWAYARAGDRDAALRELAGALKLAPERPEILAALAHIQGTLGARAEALRVIRRLSLLSKRRYVSPCDMATAYLGLGARAEALAYLERAHRERACPGPLQALHVDPLFDTLRADPRFEALVRRVATPRAEAGGS